MPVVRVGAIATTVLAAALTAPVPVAAVSTHSVTATPVASPIIAASVFVVPQNILEEQTVVMSDFQAFAIDRVSIDVVTATDDVAITFNTSFSDSVTATDVVNKMFYGNVDFDQSDPDVDPDPITVVDVDVKSVEKTLTDTTTPSDTVAKTPGKVLTDATSGATDAINQKDVGKSLTDSAAATDAVTAFNTAKVVADSASITDAAAKELTRPDVADSIAATDDSCRAPGLGKTDTVTGIDVINTFDVAKALTDTASPTDDAAKTFTRPDVVDSASATDAAAKEPGKTLTDTASATDTATTDVGKTLTDTATPADAINTFALNKSPSDSVSATDVVDKFDVTTVLADSVTMTDFIAKTPGYAFDYDITDADADPDPVTMTDVMAKEFSRPNITETVSPVDAVNLFAITKVLTETTSITDAIALELILGQTTALYPDYVSIGDGSGFVQHRFYARRPDYTAVLGGTDSLLNSSYIWNQSTESFAYENFTGLIGGPGLLMVAPLIGGEFITYADTSGSGIVVNFHYTDAPDRSVGGYKLNETPIL